MNAPLNLEQLRKQAKELARAARAAGRPVKLADAQGELARQHGFASWPSLKAYVERLGAEQPFHTDIEYYEGRAYGIATVNGGLEQAARDDRTCHRTCLEVVDRAGDRAGDQRRGAFTVGRLLAGKRPCHRRGAQQQRLGLGSPP